MSGIEIAIGVTAAVAAIVSAYKDGSTILNKIQERRRRRGVSLTANGLGEVFARGQREVFDAETDIENKFGSDFDADMNTIQTLKDITIRLQDSIIRQLAAAQDDDQFNDFSLCLKEADTARRQTVRLLSDLYSNLEAQKAIHSERTSRHGDVRVTSRTNTGLTQDHIPSREDAHPPKQRTHSWTMWRNRGQSQSDSTPTNYSRPVSAITSPTIVPSHNPAMSGPTSPLFAHQTTSVSPRAELQSSPAQSPPSRRESTLTSPMVSAVCMSRVYQIDKKSKSHDFCEGAWRTQRLELSKAMRSSIQNLERSYHCRHCKFNMLADNQSRDSACFDDRMKSSGPLYYRDLFLFKSHVAIKDNLPRYQCIFCAFAGDKSSVYKTPKRLFEHIATHRGTIYGDVQLEGSIGVNNDGIERSHLQDYDICFKFRRRQSSIQFDSLPEPALNGDGFGVYELSTDPS